MWTPPDTLIVDGRALIGHEAWVHVFVEAWLQLEPAPEMHNVTALYQLAAPLPAEFSADDPAFVAHRLYGKRPDWEPGLYPV